MGVAAFFAMLDFITTQKVRMNIFHFKKSTFFQATVQTDFSFLQSSVKLIIFLLLVWISIVIEWRSLHLNHRDIKKMEDFMKDQYSLLLMAALMDERGPWLHREREKRERKP